MNILYIILCIDYISNHAVHYIYGYILLCICYISDNVVHCTYEYVTMYVHKHIYHCHKAEL